MRLLKTFECVLLLIKNILIKFLGINNIPIHTPDAMHMDSEYKFQNKQL